MPRATSQRRGKDTLIRNARLIDGTGAPWFEADLRISNGRIAAIGAALPAGEAARRRARMLSRAGLHRRPLP